MSIVCVCGGERLFSADSSLRESRDLGPGVTGCQPKLLPAPPGQRCLQVDEGRGAMTRGWEYWPQELQTCTHTGPKGLGSMQVGHGFSGCGQATAGHTGLSQVPGAHQGLPFGAQRTREGWAVQEEGPPSQDPTQTRLQGLQVPARRPQKPCQDPSPATPHSPVPAQPLPPDPKEPPLAEECSV